MSEERKQLSLSIIVPVYNVEKYLKECLDSLLKQDVPKDCYEIICINDGSTDGSGMILDEYAKNNENINVIHKENSGVSSTRNLGVDCARGAYVWFVDADDMVRPNCLNELFKLMESDYDLIDFYSHIFNKELTEEELQLLEKNELSANWTYLLCVWLHLFKVDFLKKNNVLFGNSIKYGEDELFCVNAYEHAKKITLYNKQVYINRVHSSSTINSLRFYKNKILHVESLVEGIKYLKGKIDSQEWIGAGCKEFLKRIWSNLARAMAYLKGKDQKRFIKEIIELNLFSDEADLLNPTKKEFKKRLLIEQIKRPIREMRNSLKRLLQLK